jgi:hypothetical protein
MLNAVNLSHEALDPSAPVPSCKGRGWLSDELSQNQWTVSLMAAGQAEVARMIKVMQIHPLPTILRHPDQFEIPHLRAAFQQMKAICEKGIGFAVLDRLPIDSFDIEDIVSVYWTLGHLMGRNVAQKWDGTMIYDVTDTGQKYGYGVRGSATNVELGFHTDNAFGMQVPDFVGLLCKYPAATGGLSRFCSLYTVHERMEAKYPEALQRLYQPMLFDRQAEHSPSDPKVCWAPFFSWRGEKLRCRANTSLVRKGYAVAEQKMDKELVDALTAIDEVSAAEELWVEAPLERGQVQYLNNHELGHYRSDFHDAQDPEKKRHLYRLWHRELGAITYDG